MEICMASSLRISAYELCALLKSSVPKLQEQAFEEREKYKEGKFIIEKAKVMKVWPRCLSSDISLSAFFV